MMRWWSWGILFLLAALGGGCQDRCRPEGYRTVQTLVRDAETGAPIAGAKAHLWYRHGQHSGARTPDSADGTTDAEGRLVVPTALYDSQEWSVEAAGYQKQICSLAGIERPQREMVFHLYRDLGRVVVTLVIPDGYLGPVVVDLAPTDQLIQEQAGKRAFTYHVPQSGYVQIPAAPLLYQDEMATCEVTTAQLQYENGTVIREAVRYGASETTWLWKGRGGARTWVFEVFRGRPSGVGQMRVARETRNGPVPQRPEGLAEKAAVVIDGKPLGAVRRQSGGHHYCRFAERWKYREYRD